MRVVIIQSSLFHKGKENFNISNKPVRMIIELSLNKVLSSLFYPKTQTLL